MKIFYYVGYQPPCTIETVHQIKMCSGSEIALVYTAHELQKLNHEVCIFGAQYENFQTVQNVGYGSFDIMMNRLKEGEHVDVLIISRYVHILLFPQIYQIKKIYIWVHDLCFHPAFYQPLNATELVKQNWNHITSIVCVSEWQIQNLNQINGYPLGEKGKVIGNGVTDAWVNKISKITFIKKPFSFIWCSHHSRGLDILIRMWPKIHQMITKKFHIQPTLTICGEMIPQNEVAMQKLMFLYGNNIHCLGKIPQKVMLECMQNTQIWFYPTFFHETFCMIALEAQLAQCICIAPDIGALKETLTSKNTFLYHKELSDENIVNLIGSILSMKQNEPLTPLDENWVHQQTWKSRALQWQTLFSSSS